MNLIFDVETTGLPKFNQSDKRKRFPDYSCLDAFDSARLLSICWIITHNDTVLEQTYYIVKPDDFEIGKESIRIHGITNEVAQTQGMPVEFVLNAFIEAMTKCKNIVSHNIQFDTNIIQSELHRYRHEEAIQVFRSKHWICTMKKGKEYMGIKKFPKLAELYKALYDEDITNAHDAQYDTLYCYKCFIKLFPRDPSVFYFGDKEVRLTQEQHAVVYDQSDKNSLVIACAGGGKTSTTLCRIKYLIEQGTPETAIILMTFTRDAANDMKDKLFNIMGYKPRIQVGTIDSIAKFYTENAVMAGDSIKHVSEYGHNFLSFLQSCPKSFYNKFKYMFIDEFQDINDTQYKIIKMFHENGVKIFAVGDDAQNIYTFRGSNIEYILNFTDLFDNSSVFKLTYNFRSTNEIINMANASIENNANQIPKTMVSGITEYNGKKPRVQYFSCSSAHNAHIVKTIEEHIHNGTPHHKICVLSPLNQTLFLIEELLTKKDINHVLLDGKADVRTQAKAGHVCLSTIHKAKGLEWDVVILANMSDDVIPKLKHEKAVEEDRRLFYVGVTRARQYLYIFYYANPSTPYITRYVAELESSVYNFEDFKKEYIQGTSVIDVFTIEKSVTKLINLLDGEDYIAMKNKGIIPSIDINDVKKTKLYLGSTYTALIEREDLYSDFGIFIDAIITRIIAQAFKKRCINKHALQTLACVTLDNNEYNVYKFYKSNFKNNIAEAAKLWDNKQIAKRFLERDSRDIAYSHMDVLCKILQKVQEHSIRYGMTPDKIPIFNYRFLPENFETTIRRSHDAFSNTSRDWREIIDEIWNVSKCTRVVTEYRRRLLFKTIKGSDFINDFMPLFDKIQEHYIPYLQSLNGAQAVALHEEFSIAEGMFGEMDMRVDDTIIDFKTSINEDINPQWVLQLLCYKVLCDANLSSTKKTNQNTPSKINKICIFNPLKGMLFDIDVSQWNNGQALVQYLMDKRQRIINANTGSSTH